MLTSNLASALARLSKWRDNGGRCNKALNNSPSTWRRAAALAVRYSLEQPSPRAPLPPKYITLSERKRPTRGLGTPFCTTYS